MLYVLVNLPDGPAKPFLHLLPVERGEMLASWLLRIASRYGASYRNFSRKFLDNKTRVAVGFDAFPNIILLQGIGAVKPGTESQTIRDHSLVGTIQCFRENPDRWEDIPPARQPGRHVHNRRGAVPQMCWHICPSCRELELENGVLTWQRNPQIHGVRYCGKHCIPLAVVTNTRIRSSLPPSAADLRVMLFHPVVNPLREQQHIQLARDLGEALELSIPRLGPQRINASILRFLHNAGVTKTKPEELPWKIILPQIAAVFGSDIFSETTLDGRLYLMRTRGFHRDPGPDSMVLLALLARAYGASLAEMLQPGLTAAD